MDLVQLFFHLSTCFWLRYVLKGSVNKETNNNKVQSWVFAPVAIKQRYFLRS